MELLSYLLFIPVIAIIFLPIVLWGYGFSILYTKEFHRLRFFIGLATGAVIVLGIRSSLFLRDNSSLFAFFFWFLFLFLVSFLITAFLGLLSNKKSYLPTKYQIRYFFSHSLFFALAISLVLLFPHGSFVSSLLGSLFGYMITATLEESAKHIGYISTDTSSYESKRSMLMMTFFVVLGFVFVENILYLRGYIDIHSIGSFFRSWSMRSIFSLITHIFVSFVLTYSWWKALDYPLFSVGYISIFLLGSAGAITGHAFYNILIDSGNTIAILLYIGIALFITSGIMWKEEK